MKAKVTITVDGSIQLPVRMRKAFGVSENDKLIAEITPEGLLLRFAVPRSFEKYTPDREREFDEGEAELATVLRGNSPGTKRASGRMLKIPL